MPSKETRRRWLVITVLIALAVLAASFLGSLSAGPVTVRVDGALPRSLTNDEKGRILQIALDDPRVAQVVGGKNYSVTFTPLAWWGVFSVSNMSDRQNGSAASGTFVTGVLDPNKFEPDLVDVGFMLADGGWLRARVNLGQRVVTEVFFNPAS